jgi:protein-tyrosine phosphatase
MNAQAPEHPRTRVLFVCLGNICRSPLAEGVFLHLAGEAGLAGHFEVDSAGTGDWHVGERPDARAAAVARRHGVELPSRARQVTPDDLDAFDHVLAMDRENLRDLQRLARAGAQADIRLLRDHDPARDGDDVPDPYYGGPSGFDLVYEIVQRSCAALLAELTREP